MGYSELRAYYRTLEQIGSIRSIPSAEYADLVRQLETAPDELPEGAGCPAGHRICDGECSANVAARTQAAAKDAAHRAEMRAYRAARPIGQPFAPGEAVAGAIEINRRIGQVRNG